MPQDGRPRGKTLYGPAPRVHLVGTGLSTLLGSPQQRLGGNAVIEAFSLNSQGVRLGISLPLDG
jgi:hypothetical protein